MTLPPYLPGLGTLCLAVIATAADGLSLTSMLSMVTAALVSVALYHNRRNEAEITSLREEVRQSRLRLNALLPVIAASLPREDYQRFCMAYEAACAEQDPRRQEALFQQLLTDE